MASEDHNTSRVGPKRAAELLFCKPGTLANLRSQGLGPPYYKINRRCFYDLRDIEDYIRQHRVVPADYREEEDARCANR